MSTIRRGWRNRGHLPHADFAGLTQAITFRLADALPENVLMRLRCESSAQAGGTASERRDALLRERLHAWLDAGHGSCLLRDPCCQDIIIEECRRHDGEGHRIEAMVVMPNHVHVVARMGGVSLGAIIRQWKEASARRINQRMGLVGTLWHREYHDRFIRDEAHLIAALRYVAGNPVVAGLVSAPEDWPGWWMRDELKEWLGMGIAGSAD